MNRIRRAFRNADIELMWLKGFAILLSLLALLLIGLILIKVPVLIFILVGISLLPLTLGFMYEVLTGGK